MIPAKRNQGWMPSIFNDFFDNDWMLKTNATAPAINVSEDDKEYKVEVAAPGMTKEDFKITLDEDNNLVIEMEKKVENEEKNNNKKYLRREFSYSKFSQTILLPDNVEKENISAKVDNGILAISIPKMDEEKIAKAPKCIDIA